MKRILRLAVIVGLAYGIYQMFTRQKSQWEGLTETEVRTKLDDKLSGRVPPEKAQMIGDKVVGKMKSKGILADDAGMNGAAETETITT